LHKTDDFLEASNLKITLEKSEVFVYHKQLFQRDDHLSKRSIIFPFTFIYSNTDWVSFEPTNNAYFTKSETKFILDRIVMRATSTDSFVALTAIDAIQAQLASYRQYKPFPELSGATVHFYPRLTIPRDELRSIQHTIKILHTGVQIVKT
jgi:hypothetical protein